MHEAIEQYELALTVNPNYVDGHRNLAVLLQQKGRAGEAASHRRTAEELSGSTR